MAIETWVAVLTIKITWGKYKITTTGAQTPETGLRFQMGKRASEQPHGQLRPFIDEIGSFRRFKLHETHADELQNCWASCGSLITLNEHAERDTKTLEHTAPKQELGF